ncbi:MAG: hypothetical protein K5841_03865 [Fretibacterium sp.]|nr:hypothetical protein [Fretibacterium sp.]
MKRTILLAVMAVCLAGLAPLENPRQEAADNPPAASRRDFFSLSSALAAEMPRAQLDESERQFTRAYLHFMERDYWSALDYLDRALRANTYLVDYYLLSGLTLQRTGDGDRARAALANYLEVRPMDNSVPRIARSFVEQDRLLRIVMGTRPLSPRWQLSKPDLQTEMQLPLAHPFNIRGLGKAEALGNVFCAADTLGDRVYLRPADASGISAPGPSGDGEQAAPPKIDYRTFDVPKPVTVLPHGDRSFTLFCGEGDVYFFTCPLDGETPVSLDLRGHLDSDVSDAEALSENTFAISDPVGRIVSFYRIDSAGQGAPELLSQWTAPAAEMLFEPVALDGFGEWLAVADRGNARVYFLNVSNRRESFFTEVPAPRDIMWSPLGELFVLTERGDIFCLTVDLGEKTASAGSPLWSGLKDIWTFFPSAEGDIYCLDISAFHLHKLVMQPSRTINQGFLGIYHPTLALESPNRESFLINATLGGPFTSHLQDSAIVVQCVWNERTMRSSAQWTAPPRFLDGLVLYRALAPGQSLPPTLKSAQVTRGRDIRSVIPPVWALHRETLTHIIVDASIPFSADDILYLMRFCLMNGLELDVWARDIPPVSLVRASAFTGGKTLLSLRRTPELSVPRSRLQIQIPLPQELSSSGYPSRSMLAVYLDIGLMQTRAWMPLWPDLTGQ